MEKVVCIRVITTTDDYPNAETDDLVKVHILDRDKFILDSISLDKPNYNDRELGQTDEHIKLLDGFMNLDTIRWFRIQIYGNNAWKPRAIMIKLGLLSNKTIIACHYAPLFYWLSTDRRDANGRAEPAWDLPIMQLGLPLYPEDKPMPSFSEGDIVDPHTGAILAGQEQALAGLNP